MSCPALSRRELLALSGISATSGCLDVLDIGNRGAQIGQIHLQNMHEKSHRLDVTVERNGESVVEQSVSLDGETKEIIEPSWPADPTRYAITVAIDEDWIHTVEYGDDDSLENGCTIVYVTIAPNGVPAIGTSPSNEVSGECPE